VIAEAERPGSLDAAIRDPAANDLAALVASLPNLRLVAFNGGTAAKLGGLVFSQRVMLALTQKGVSREDAYAAVQGNSMKVWRGEGRFIDFLKADAVVSKALSDAELEELFDYGYHTKNVDVIFKRVFGEQA
jgi:hypothetical protein